MFSYFSYLQPFNHAHEVAKFCYADKVRKLIYTRHPDSIYNPLKICEMLQFKNPKIMFCPK